MLELQNISVCVESSREILKNINLTIEDSKFIVITGPNGGGKSTLAKVIAGILPPAPAVFYSVGKILQMHLSRNAPKWELAMRFSNRFALKGLPCAT